MSGEEDERLSADTASIKKLRNDFLHIPYLIQCSHNFLLCLALSMQLDGYTK
jgi:hypothetical protein